MACVDSFLDQDELCGHGVRLEPLQDSHRDELVAVVSDGELWKLWYTLVPSPEQVESYIAEALATRASGASIPWLIRAGKDLRPVGTTRFCNIDGINRRAEIGYTVLAKGAQRSSVNSACKLLLLEQAFDKHGAIAIEFRTHWHNLASRRAIERLGAKQDGVLRQHRRGPGDSYRDTVVFSILDREWPSVKLGLQGFLGR